MNLKFTLGILFAKRSWPMVSPVSRDFTSKVFLICKLHSFNQIFCPNLNFIGFKVVNVSKNEFLYRNYFQGSSPHMTTLVKSFMTLQGFCNISPKLISLQEICK